MRELPEPIISKELNDGIAAILSTTSHQIGLIWSDFGEGQEVLNELRTILYSLPQQNFDLFKHIVGFLMHVAAHSDKNKMNTNNLLRVMTPTLNISPGMISLAMEHYDFFFENGTTRKSIAHLCQLKLVWNNKLKRLRTVFWQNQVILWRLVKLYSPSAFLFKKVKKVKTRRKMRIPHPQETSRSNQSFLNKTCKCLLVSNNQNFPSLGVTLFSTKEVPALQTGVSKM